MGEPRNAHGTLAGTPTEKKLRGQIRGEENIKMGAKQGVILKLHSVDSTK
jgi:hypothetical protein